MSILEHYPPPEPTQKQLDELSRDLQPLRDENPGIRGEDLLRTPQGMKIHVEWKRRHKLLHEDQPVKP